jgi:uncharacterized protein (TIGR03067 family)
MSRPVCFGLLLLGLLPAAWALFPGQAPADPLPPVSSDIPKGKSLDRDWKTTSGTLSGVYKVASLTFAGAEQDDWKGLKFTFKGNKLTRQDPSGTDMAYTFKAVTSKKPHEFDLVPEDGESKGEALKGIFTIKDDELQLCLPISPDDGRPEEFASKDGEPVALIVLKREKR